jgi:hypothetical protein
MSASPALKSTLTRLTLPLASGAVGYRNDPMGVVPGAYSVKLASSATNLIAIGTAVEDYSQVAGDTTVQVDLPGPVDLVYLPNATDAGAVSIAANFLGKCYYAVDGSYVTTAKTGGGANLALAGIVYDVSSRDGVGFKPVQPEIEALIS